MDKALVFGAKDCSLEPCQDQIWVTQPAPSSAQAVTSPACATMKICRDDGQAPCMADIAWLLAQQEPPWPNGQGVGPLIRRLWARVPQGVWWWDTFVQEVQASRTMGRGNIRKNSRGYVRRFVRYNVRGGQKRILEKMPKRMLQNMLRAKAWKSVHAKHWMPQLKSVCMTWKLFTFPKLFFGPLSPFESAKKTRRSCRSGYWTLRPTSIAGDIAQRLERLPADQQVRGLTPGAPFTLEATVSTWPQWWAQL